MFAAIDWTTATQWLSDPKHLFDAISFVLGLLYLFLEFKASIWLWPVGIVMPIVHSVTYYKAGLYADFGMEFFYVIVAVYGFLKWRMGKGADKKDVPITHFPIRMAIIAVVAFGAIWGGIFWFLSTCTDSTSSSGMRSSRAALRCRAASFSSGASFRPSSFSTAAPPLQNVQRKIRFLKLTLSFPGMIIDKETERC